MLSLEHGRGSSPGSVVSGIRDVIAGVVAGVVLELTFGGSGIFHGVSGSGDVMQQHREGQRLQAEKAETAACKRRMSSYSSSGRCARFAARVHKQAS